MFKILCSLALISLALSAPAGEDGEDGHQHPAPLPKANTEHHIINIVEQGSEHKDDGSYSFFFRGEDGSFRQETAVVINPGTEDAYLEITGSYSYYDVDGKEQVVNYKADKHGFVPEGGSISQEIATAAKQVSQIVVEEPTKHEIV